MGFRFWKRINLAPGVTINLSKTGPSLSVGPRGAKLTVGGRGARASVGVPGTGLYYTKNLTPRRKAKTGGRKGQRAAAPAALPDAAAVPPNEKALVEGCRLLAAGDEAAALAQLRQAANEAQLADGACLAGYVALKNNSLEEAEKFLAAALAGAGQLGQHLAKYAVRPEVELPITEEIAALLGPDERGVLLALPEAAEEVLAGALRRKKGRPAELLAALHYERALLMEAQGKAERASADLQKAYALAPDYEDVAARLGL